MNSKVYDLELEISASNIQSAIETFLRQMGGIQDHEDVVEMNVGDTQPNNMVPLTLKLKRATPTQDHLKRVLQRNLIREDETKLNGKEKS